VNAAAKSDVYKLFCFAASELGICNFQHEEANKTINTIASISYDSQQSKGYLLNACCNNLLKSP
jgi:hypothetical protein